MERITCVDVGEAIGNLRWLIEHSERKELISAESSRRYKGYVNLLARQAAENPTAPLTAGDL